VADMARRQLSLQELPDSADATDALAIALTHHVASRSPLAQIRPAGAKGKGFDVDAYLQRIGRSGSRPSV